MSNTGTRTAIYRNAIFIISCCHFQHSLSTRKAFNSNPILNLWNDLHATLLPSVIALATLETKKLPTDLSVGLETSSDVEAQHAQHPQHAYLYHWKYALQIIHTFSSDYALSA